MPRKRQEVTLQDSDWEALFPGQDHTIGTTTFKITPLSVEDLSIVLKRVSTITTQIAELQLTADDFTGEGADRLVGLVQLIVEEAPDILAQMSGLSVGDIKGLPIPTTVDLFNKVLDVNINSQEDLVKNFKGLAERFQKFTNPTALLENQEGAALQ